MNSSEQKPVTAIESVPAWGVAAWPIVFAVAATLGGCAMEGRQPRVLVPHVDVDASPRYEGAEQHAPWVGAVAEGSIPLLVRVDDFVSNAIALADADSKRVAVLPAVAYDVRRGRPWVPELGVRLAEVVRSRLAARQAFASVLTDGEVIERLAGSGVEKRMFSNYDRAVLLAPSLDVELVVFSSLRLEYDVGRLGRSVVTIEMIEFEAATGREVSRMRCEVGDELPSNAELFELTRRDSTWLIAN